MKHGRWLARVLGLMVALAGSTWADVAPPSAKPMPPAPVAAATPAAEVTVRDVVVRARLEGPECTFQVSLTAEALRAGAEIPLASGDVVLAAVPKGEGWHLRFDRAAQAYLLVVTAGQGPVAVAADFLARAVTPDAAPQWRETTFRIADAPARRLELAADRADLQVELPGALQVVRKEDGGKLLITGILGPDQPVRARWQAQVEAARVELLLASEANSIVTVSPGALRLDSLYSYQINQGKLTELRFAVPKALGLTQVRGQHLRDWRTEPGATENTLIVRLNREQEKQYALQLIGEMPLPALPTELDLPVVRPLDGTRADGHLALGTNSAIQLQVRQSAGLAQIDLAAFPRALLEPEQTRELPGAKAFFYAFAATPWQMRLALSDIVPSYDVESRLEVLVKDDDLTLAGELLLDVRDAHVRRLRLHVPAVFAVAEVSGELVGDYTVTPPAAAGDPKVINLELKQPLLGTGTLKLRLELGRGPIGATHELKGLAVPDARSERGFIAVAAGAGVLVDAPVATELRPVHTRSIPMRVAEAQYAWRFRDRGWALQLPVREKPAAIRAEAFHLLSLGDGVAYGSVVYTYFISGAPVDELRFKAGPELRDVEFNGLDVSRSDLVDGVWVVKLARKVMGDYNLGVTFTQRFEGTGQVTLGGITGVGLERQMGFLTLASHLNVQTAQQTADPSIIPVGYEEIPQHYRLLVSAPVLGSYKYVDAPHVLALKVTPYERGATPPVVVEFTEVWTDLSLDPDGKAESVTRVRFTIKNASAQFLELAGAKDLRRWPPQLIETLPNGQERATVLPLDVAGDVLKIPLRRQRDPNTPLTIELKYTQVHGDLGWRGGLRLTLPRSLVRSTYATWQVKAPAGWSVTPGGGGSMTVMAPPPRCDLAAVLYAVVRGWDTAVERALRTPAVPLYVLFLAILLGVNVGVRRRWLANLFMLAALGLWLVLGLTSAAPAAADRWQGAPVQQLSLAQVLNLDDQAPVVAAVRVVPAWRQDFGLFYTALALLVAAGAAWLTRRGPRWRAPGLAVCVTAIIVVLCQWAPLGTALIHLGTWGLPAVLLLVLVVWLARGGTAAWRSSVALFLVAAWLVVVAVPRAVADDAKAPTPAAAPAADRDRKAHV